MVMKRTTLALRKILAVSISILAVSAMAGDQKVRLQAPVSIQRPAASSPKPPMSIAQQDLVTALELSRADQQVSYRHSSWGEYVR